MHSGASSLPLPPRDRAIAPHRWRWTRRKGFPPVLPPGDTLVANQIAAPGRQATRVLAAAATGRLPNQTRRSPMSGRPRITDGVVATPAPGAQFAWTDEQLAAAIDTQTPEVGDGAEPPSLGEAEDQS